MLSQTRDQSAAETLVRQTLSNSHCSIPSVIGVDKNAAYHLAFEAIPNQRLISMETDLRQVKYLNNIVEQDHWFSKRRIAWSQWFPRFATAETMIAGHESMHMIRKGQVQGIERKDAAYQKIFIEALFGIAA